MKERITRLIEMEQLTPSRFADIIGVQRSSVSHVLSGRNNPSFDFLQKTLKAFPGLKADWLMLGKGTMYEQMGRNEDLFGQNLDVIEEIQSEVPNAEGQSSFNKNTESEGASSKESIEYESDEDDLTKESAEEVKGTDTAGHLKEVVQVMVFYSDNTFRSFRPTD
jgi:transcriptional regulator with XRE-family HTH domain